MSDSSFMTARAFKQIGVCLAVLVQWFARPGGNGYLDPEHADRPSAATVAV
jgi:hypothetical protein